MLDWVDKATGAYCRLLELLLVGGEGPVGLVDGLGPVGAERPEAGRARLRADEVARAELCAVGELGGHSVFVLT